MGYLLTSKFFNGPKPINYLLQVGIGTNSEKYSPFNVTITDNQGRFIFNSTFDGLSPPANPPISIRAIENYPANGSTISKGEMINGAMYIVNILNNNAICAVSNNYFVANTLIPVLGTPSNATYIGFASFETSNPVVTHLQIVDNQGVKRIEDDNIYYNNRFYENKIENVNVSFVKISDDSKTLISIKGDLSYNSETYIYNSYSILPVNKVLSYPFSFSNGTVKYHSISVSLQSLSSFSSSTSTKITVVSPNGAGRNSVNAEINPSFIIDLIKPQVLKVETVFLSFDKVLLRIYAKDVQLGISIITTYSNKASTADLVYGDNFNGVYEVVETYFTSFGGGNTIPFIKIFDNARNNNQFTNYQPIIDTSFNMLPENPFYIYIKNQTDLDPFTFTGFEFKFNDIDVSNGPFNNTLCFSFAGSTSSPFYVRVILSQSSSKVHVVIQSVVSTWINSEKYPYLQASITIKNTGTRPIKDFSFIIENIAYNQIWGVDANGIIDTLYHLIIQIILDNEKGFKVGNFPFTVETNLFITTPLGNDNNIKMNFTNMKLKSIGFSQLNLLDDHLCNGNNATTEGIKCDNYEHSNQSSLKVVENFFNHHDFSAFLSFNSFQHHHHHESKVDNTFCTNLSKLKSEFISSILPQNEINRSSSCISTTTAAIIDGANEITLNDEIIKKNESLSTLLIYFLSDILIHQPFDSLAQINKSLKKFFNISDKLLKTLFKKSLSLTKYYLLEINKYKEYYLKLQDFESEEFGGDKILMEKIKSFNLKRIDETEKKNQNIKYLNFLNTVMVKVYSAKGLEIKDLISSDPYVNLFFTDSQDEKPHHHRESLNTIYLNDEKQKHHHHHNFKTTVKKSTLTPEWNEQFIMSTDKPDQNILIASIYDFDQVSKSDFMGFLPIHLEHEHEHEENKSIHNSEHCNEHGHHEYLNHSNPIVENIQEYELLSKPKGNLTKFKSLLGITGSPDIKNDNEIRKYGKIKLGLIHLKREILKVEDINVNNQNLPSKQIDIQMNQNHENSIKSIIEFAINSSDEINLPNEIEKLLESFSSRVLLSPLIIPLIKIEKLIENFQISTSTMDEIHKILTQSIELVTIKKIPLSKPIEERFLAMLKSLKKLYKGIISRYPLSFPITLNQETKLAENIGSSGTLLTLTIETLELIYNYQSKPCKLKKMVENYIEFCWTCVKEKSLISIEDSKDFENIVGLLDIYDAIEAQLVLDIEIYSQFFPAHFDLASISSKSYYRLLKEETERLLAKEDKVCMETFNLLKKIQKIEKTIIKPYEKEIESMMDLNQLFKRFIKMWIKEIKKQFNLWVGRSLEKEEWKSIDSKNNQLHSNSLIDLFTIFEIGKNHLLGLDLDIDQFIFELIDIVNQLYNQYLDIVLNSILSDLKRDISTPLFIDEVNDNYISSLSKFISKIKLSNVDDDQQSSKATNINASNGNISNIQITNSIICIKLNCLEFSRQLLFDLSSDLELKLPHLKDKIQDSFGISFLNSKKKYDYIIDLVINNISKWIKVLLVQMLDSKSNGNNGVCKLSKDQTPSLLNENQVNELLDSLSILLNNELTILSGNLYYPTFSKFIRGVWQSIWKEFDRILFPEFKLQSEKLETTFYKSLVILSIYPALEEFFNADGSGVSIEQLRNHSEYLLSTISVYISNPLNLLEVYNTISSSIDSKPPSPIDYSFVNSKLFSINQFDQFKSFTFKKNNYIKELHVLCSISSYCNSGNSIITNGFITSELDSSFKKILSTLGSFKNRFILDKFSLDPSVSLYQNDFKCKTLNGIPSNAYVLNDCLCWSNWLCYNETKVVLKYSSLKSITRQQHESNDVLFIITMNDDKTYDIWSITSQDSIFKSLILNSKKLNQSIEIIDHIKSKVEQHTSDNSNFIVKESTSTVVNKEGKIIDIQPEHESHVSYDDSIVYHTLFHLDKDNIIYQVYPCFTGKLITTRDYFCHHNNLTKANKHYLWSEIVEVKKEKVLFFDTGLKVTFKNGTNESYSGINDRDLLYKELVQLKDLNKSNSSPLPATKKFVEAD
ncbi:hypothetical protein ACTA71_010154 [Dictyostelium dimigraforme]